MKNRRRLLAFGVGLALAWCSLARGQAPQGPSPAGVADLIAARGLSLGAYRGVAAGNDGIFTNAASLAARRRYAIEASWLLDRVAGDNALQVFGASVVDSETASVTGGFAYNRVVSGPWTGNLFHLPIAFPVTDRLFLGATGKYQSLDGASGSSIRAGNVDLSAFFHTTGGFGLGVAGYNLISTGHVKEQPRGIGVGASYGDERRYHVAVDWRGDLETQGKTTSLFAVGGELLLGDVVPLRASYLKDETRDASFWSVGAGLVSSSGVAIDAGFRQGIDNTSDRTFAVTLKMFLASH